MNSIYWNFGMKKLNVEIPLFQTMKFIYYNNTNEIPGELSLENMISRVSVKSGTLPEPLSPPPPTPPLNTPEHPHPGIGIKIIEFYK